MAELTFSNCEISKTGTWFLPGILSLKTGIWVPQFKLARPKIRKEIIWIPHQTLGTQDFLPAYSVLCKRNRMWTQKTDAEHNRHKSWAFTAAFLSDIQKTLLQNVWYSRSRSTTQKSFLQKKNLGRLQCFLFEFSQRPKVSSIIIVTIEIVKNYVLLAGYKRCPSPMRGNPSPWKHQVALDIESVFKN